VAEKKTFCWLLCVWLLLALTQSGCERLFQSRSTRALELAQKKEKDGDFKAAVDSYEAALDGTPKTADVHYRLAMLYDEKFSSPVSALHHFQRYLELEPKGSHAKDARNFVSQDELKLGTSLAGGGFMSQADAARLKNENLKLNDQLVESRKQIAELRSLASHPPQQKISGKNIDAQQQRLNQPIPPGAKTYTVQPHDTLALISRKFFKTAARAQDIQDANFNTLNGTTKIKPGMTLIIPAK